MGSENNFIFGFILGAVIVFIICASITVIMTDNELLVKAACENRTMVMIFNSSEGETWDGPNDDVFINCTARGYE
jgi:hypothetical protein